MGPDCAHVMKQAQMPVQRFGLAANFAGERVQVDCGRIRVGEGAEHVSRCHFAEELAEAHVVAGAAAAEEAR